MKQKSNIFLLLGLLFLGLGLFLAGYNLYEEEKASLVAEEALMDLKEEIEDNPSKEEYVKNPDMEMPTKKIRGKRYIGWIAIPSLGIELPVLDEYSESNLKLGPNRYEGSLYQDNMILIAHAYRNYFGRIGQLKKQDQVIFTDVDGHVFVYEVIQKETIRKEDFEKMREGDWDLTLFTCTFDNQSRTTIRLRRIEMI